MNYKSYDLVHWDCVSKVFDKITDTHWLTQMVIVCAKFGDFLKLRKTKPVCIIGPLDTKTEPNNSTNLDYLGSSIKETGFEDPEINNEDQRDDLMLGFERTMKAEPGKLKGNGRHFCHRVSPFLMGGDKGPFTTDGNPKNSSENVGFATQENYSTFLGHGKEHIFRILRSFKERKGGEATSTPAARSILNKIEPLVGVNNDGMTDGLKLWGDSKGRIQVNCSSEDIVKNSKVQIQENYSLDSIVKNLRVEVEDMASRNKSGATAKSGTQIVEVYWQSDGKQMPLLRLVSLAWLVVSLGRRKDRGTCLLPIGSNSRDVFAIDASTSEGKWKSIGCHATGIVSLSFPNRGHILHTVCNVRIASEMNSETGEFVWEFKVSKTHISSLALCAEQILAILDTDF